MKLFHATKVTVRKALAALRGLDETWNQSRYAQERVGGRDVDTENRRLETRIATKAGFRSRVDLETFARKHNLL